MRICFLCSEYPPGPHGGIGTFTRVLARALVGAGHPVRVVGAYPVSYPAPDREEDLGVEVHRLRVPAGRFGWLAARLAEYRVVKRWADAGEIDIVDMPDWEGPACGWPPLRVPVAVRLNGSATYFAAELGKPVRRSAYFIERASLRRADAWSAASVYIAEKTATIFGLEPSDVTTLYNPVEEPVDEPGIERGEAEVVFTGTLTEKKGVVSLVKAWPLVLEKIPDARLHFYGKDGSAPGIPSMRAHLVALLPETARGSVVFHGHVERTELKAALRRARAAVFPSYAESFGIAPFEAMGTACPTIYSRRGPGPELVRDGVDGLLVEPGNPEEIAGAILRLLGDDVLARRLGVAGRERVKERFSINRLLPQNLEFFARCLAGRMPSRVVVPA